MIKLSQAIPVGINLYPVQIKKRYFDTKNSGACAIGAAFAGMGILPGACPSFFSVCPDAMEQLYVCPECKRSNDLFSAIVDLNDNHSWTREAIAEWLRGEGL